LITLLLLIGRVKIILALRLLSRSAKIYSTVIPIIIFAENYWAGQSVSRNESDRTSWEEKN